MFTYIFKAVKDQNHFKLFQNNLRKPSPLTDSPMRTYPIYALL